MELDLFGEPIQPNPKLAEVPEPVPTYPLPDSTKEFDWTKPTRPIQEIVKEAIPGGVRTTIWNS